MSSSSDEEQVKYEEVTDLKKVKELEKKAKKTAITPVIIEDDRHQTKPVMIAISEKDQKTKKDEGPDKKKTKEEKYENQQSRKGTNKPK